MVILSDCEFGDWQEGPCSLTCGGGVKVLTREILKEAEGHGACAGDTMVVSLCHNQPCDRDCLWADWEAEAACSKACGGGAQTLTRRRARNASGNGLPCQGENTRLAHCNEALCPGVVLLIVVLVLLLLFAPLGFLCYRNKYSRLHTPNISFRVPNSIRLWK